MSVRAGFFCFLRRQRFTSGARVRSFLLVVSFFMGLGSGAEPVFASEDPIPTRYALGVDFGQTYAPNAAIDLAQVTVVALFDYDRVWPHRAPAALRFKLEGSAGMTTAPRNRALVSAKMLALYFLDDLATERLRPYVEAGIGVIYTDFQVKNQGLRINFNPQAGIGTELKWGDGPPWYAALRMIHISNGGMHPDNAGINAVMLQFGKFF